jgi:hypothetical protein
MGMSETNIEVGLEQGLNAFDVDATGPASTKYFVDQREIQECEEAKRKERLFGLIQAVPKPIVGLSGFETQFSSNATISQSMLSFPIRTRPEITDSADYFISRQKKSVKYRGEILKVTDRVSECLKKDGVDAEVIIDLFTDPEHSDWVEPKIQILVSKDQLSKTYQIFDELLEFAFSGISQKTLRKLSVTIDTRQ